MSLFQSTSIATVPASIPDPGCCLVCGEPHSFVGVYTPGPAQQASYRPRPKGFRTFVYGLCRLCSAKPDVLDTVEKHLNEPLNVAMTAGQG